jgi:hypothetical protein
VSRIFGEIRQNGYVVRDIESAMAHWLEVLGIGPFFYFSHVEAEEFFYKDEPCRPDLSIALANSGDMQIELIEQHDDTPTMYKAFLDAGHEGLQHVSSWVEDFDGTVERLLSAGHTIGQRGALPGGIKFAYFETELHPGSVFEVSNLAGPLAYIPQAVADAARDWDGSEPIRRVDLAGPA